MPTYPTALQGRKVNLHIDVSNTSTPSWSRLCTMENFTLSVENLTEEKYLPACDDDNAIPQRQTIASGQKWTITGTGVSDPANTAYARLKARALAGTNVKVRVQEATTDGDVWTGDALPSKFDLTGGGAFSAISITLEGASALVQTDYVAP